MSLLNALAVWQQIPVANRTVGAAASVTGAVGSVTTVNDKTGYSLTAGSYSVRASSSQRGTISNSGSATATATISSVTTTRATLVYVGNSVADPTVSDGSAICARGTLTNSTTVTNSRSTTVNHTPTMGFEVFELF